MIKLISTIVLFSLVVGCKSSKLVSTFKQLDFGAFTIQAPSSWEKVTKRGIDSYVGAIKIDSQDTLHFDLGMYSNTLSSQNQSVTWEEIDGFEVKIVSPKSGTKGITGVYIDSLSGKGLNRNHFNLYGRNITLMNRKEFLRSIRTLKFKK